MPRPIAVRPFVGSFVAAAAKMKWIRAKATWSSWLGRSCCRGRWCGGVGSVFRVHRATDVHRGQDREDEGLQEADEDFEARHRHEKEERERHDHDAGVLRE